MTSPSRRKHRTTRRNSRQGNNPYAASGLALVAMAATALVFMGDNAAAKELQWRRGRAPAAKVTVSKPRRDPAVRPAAFEDDGNSLQLSDVSAGKATLRSIVVNRDEQFDTIRSAQLPTDDTAQPSAPTNGTEQFEEQLRTPFGQLPAEEPQQPPPTEQPSLEDELGIEGLDLPDDETVQPGIEPSPADRPAQPTFQQPPPSIFQQPLGDESPGPEGPMPDVEAETLAQEERDVQALCSSELADLRASTLTDVDLTIVIRGTEGEDFPFECTIDDGTWHPGRCWDQKTFMWKASALCHKPLYFEDESLERYGHSWGPCLDPLVSGAHFFTRLPVLPYCMGVEPPNECIYALGHYRPGSCAPYMIHPVPISARGALFQAGATTGAVFLLP